MGQDADVKYLLLKGGDLRQDEELALVTISQKYEAHRKYRSTPNGNFISYYSLYFLFDSK